MSMIHDSAKTMLTFASVIATKCGSKHTELKHVLLAYYVAPDEEIEIILFSAFKDVQDNEEIYAAHILPLFDKKPDIEAVSLGLPSDTAALFSSELLDLLNNTQEVITVENLIYLLLDKLGIDPEAISPIDDSHQDDTEDEAQEISKPIQEEGETGMDPLPSMEDLVQMAKDGKLDPVIGRAEEIDKLTGVLLKRIKRNPILVGKPGVGKTAIVEGLAHRIAKGTCHPRLKDKRIYVLDLTSLTAGTIYRGQFEGRMKSLIQFLEGTPNAILFIDEVHLIVGAGSAGDKAMDMSNLLKPALGRGSIQVIGATTEEEYERIAADGALSRRFNTVAVKEPTPTETVNILSGLRDVYQNFYKVKIEDKSIEEAVRLSIAHIHNNNLPDKAIDLLDEACIQAMYSTKSPKIDKLQDTLSKLEVQFNDLVLEGDLFKASKIRRQTTETQENITKATDEFLASISVEPEHIEKAVHSRIGSTGTLYDKSSKKAIASLKTTIQNKIANQDTAIAEFLDVIRAGNALSRNPIACLTLVGPKGCGKREVAKQIAATLFSNYLELDMTDYTDPTRYNELFGSSKGYIGSDKGGLLVNELRHNPNTMIVVRNADKAPHTIIRSLTSAIEKGMVNDSTGRSCSLKNTAFVFTITPEVNTKSLGFNTDTTKVNYTKLVPKELSTVSRVLELNPLTAKDVKKILDLQLEKLSSRLDRKIEVDPSLYAYLEPKFDTTLAAYSVRKMITDEIEIAISDLPGYEPIKLTVENNTIKAYKE